MRKQKSMQQTPIATARAATRYSYMGDHFLQVDRDGLQLLLRVAESFRLLSSPLYYLFISNY